MGKIAFIFPGQGAQHMDMAKDFYDFCGESRRIFEEASLAAGFSIEEICFRDEGRLNQTQYTQPALFAANCAILKAVEEAGIRPDITAGLSLGEYCALMAANVLDFSDAVKVVCSRGKYMEEEVPQNRGSMAAVLSRKELPLEEICGQVKGTVVVANYNCPGQRVISGEREAVEEAAERMLEAGASRVVPLNVSGPFHSPMLKGAGEKLYNRLEQVPIAEPSIPFVSNVTAREEREPEQIRDLLGMQVCSPVHWQQSIEYMIENGADTFIEIGPGRTLSNLMKKIDRSVKVYNVETIADLETVRKELRA